MGRTIAELAAVIDRCGAHPWLGVCLDSAHLYASGIDVGDVGAVEAMLDELDGTIGLDRLKALHINAAFLGRPRLQGLPAVLETPGHDGKGADAQCMQALERLWRLGQ